MKKFEQVSEYNYSNNIEKVKAVEEISVKMLLGVKKILMEKFPQVTIMTSKPFHMNCYYINKFLGFKFKHSIYFRVIEKDYRGGQSIILRLSRPSGSHYYLDNLMIRNNKELTDILKGILK